jgi:predicted CxxxxCH...CXXCH cytochrome family protein
VDPTKHVNGRTDASGGACDSCHGDATRTTGPKDAPPKDARGNVATTARGVGAHQSHLKFAQTLTSAPVACTECHATPGSAGHGNGVVEVQFGPFSRLNGSMPAWNAATLSCSGNYCHGAKNAGGAVTAPLWTKVDGTQKTCISCHGRPPSDGKHTKHFNQGISCASCHPGYTATAVNRTVHMNGIRNAGATTKLTKFDPVTRRCTLTCHGAKTW